MAKVEQWTEEQQEAYKKKFPGASPKPWVVMDGQLVYGSYDSEGDALAAVAESDRDDAIGERFNVWMDEIIGEYKVSEDVVKEIVEAQL